MPISRLDRLNFIERNPTRLTNWKDLVEEMIDRGMVSKYYSVRCLKMDVWYIRRSYRSNCVRSFDGYTGIANSLYFHVILQSLIDLQTGRPCDLGAWKIDQPSDHKYCTMSEHLCYADAEEFLKKVDNEEEKFAGVSPGCVDHLVRTIKRDPIFSIESLIRE